MSRLPDELLMRIRDGSGRVYTHEAKSMAAELMVYREREKAAAKGANLSQSRQGSATVGGPWGAGPMP